MRPSVARTAAWFAVVLAAGFLKLPAAQAVHFDESAPDQIRVRTPQYEVAFDKSNGSIAGITDRASGQVVSPGTLDGQLWRAQLFSGCAIGGRAEGFSYRWLPTVRQLVLDYPPLESGEPRLSARVTVTFSDQRHFDLEAEIRNNSGERLLRVDIPHALSFSAADIQEAFFPVLPGIRFNRRFFEEGRAWNHGHYPRNTVFADYAHFGFGDAGLTMYSILKEDATPIVRRAISPEAGVYVWRHAYEMAVPDGGVWKSPKVRILVGAPLSETIETFRNDTGLAATPSLREKLGKLYAPVVSALSTKCDVFSILYEFQHNLTKREAYQALWESLPGPAILFVCSYPRGGQDESNPDIFPVDPRLGTDADFRAVLESARRNSHLVMPYVNPTFWDEDSETVKSLRVEDFAAMYEEGAPRREGYSGHYGYAVTPQAPAVQDRLQRLMSELTAKISADLIWEDQVGSRYGLDFNPHCPNPALHAQGWLEHTRRYQGLKLMAEHGHDRQVASHVGFQGNLLLYEPGGDFGDSEWGKGTWEYYPIVPMMARDKVLFYNAPDHYVRSKEGLTWTLAMGQMPSYDIHKSTLNTPWHKTASLIQQLALSRFADKRLTQYQVGPGDVTTSRFGEWRVIANRSSARAHSVGRHLVVPDGFLLSDDAGSVTAGVFSRFAGQDLSEGDHYLIVTRDKKSVVVYQPQGADTPIELDLPPSAPNSQWQVFAVAGSSNIAVPFKMHGGRVRFDWKRNFGGKEVEHYCVEKRDASPRASKISHKRPR